MGRLPEFFYGGGGPTSIVSGDVLERGKGNTTLIFPMDGDKYVLWMGWVVVICCLLRNPCRSLICFLFYFILGCTTNWGVGLG